MSELYQNFGTWQSPEVLVLGGGAAALAAAIEAAHTGCRVLLLEAAPRHQRGGNTRHSRNLRYTHNRENPLSQELYTTDEFYQELMTASNHADPELGELLVKDSAELPAWLAAANVHCEPATNPALPYSRRTLFLLGGGMSMLNQLYHQAESLGVEICYDAKATRLELDGGEIKSVNAVIGERQETIKPTRLIVATGGHQANKQWLISHMGKQVQGFINRGSEWVTGDMLDQLLDAGASAVGDPTHAYLVAVDGRAPTDGGIATRIRGIPYGIVVNNTGRRFADEGAQLGSARYAIWGQRIQYCPEQLAYLIVDQKGWQQCPPTLFPPVIGANIGELAKQLEMPVGMLAETLAQYNEAVRENSANVTTWHTEGLEPPKSSMAAPLLTPPFYAWPIRPGITFTSFGVKVNAHAQIMGRWGTSQTIYAAGMCMAANLLGTGYLSGTALTLGLVFGRIAGRQAGKSIAHV